MELKSIVFKHKSTCQILGSTPNKRTHDIPLILGRVPRIACTVSKFSNCESGVSLDTATLIDPATGRRGNKNPIDAKLFHVVSPTAPIFFSASSFTVPRSHVKFTSFPGVLTSLSLASTDRSLGACQEIDSNTQQTNARSHRREVSGLGVGRSYHERITMPVSWISDSSWEEN